MAPTLQRLSFLAGTSTLRPFRSSKQLHWPKPKRFDVELPNLEVTEEDFVKVFGNHLESSILKAKDLADEHPVFVPGKAGQGKAGQVPTIPVLREE
jgi:hypothetical protein